ncbi:MAG: glycosyl hydrolase [Burkholderiales bacterium]|nr:glycosyl hydrolase [Burkholderiales bacterium]MDE2398238.1 glycosyl hydrolase [Burkholderiales bacterium]MDE2454352.1 glycosyl hydrolase [Burkholderiales bacterium]
MSEWPEGPAICYSGYRRGQSPESRVYPSLDEIREDLLLLSPHWRLLRLYDCSPHAERVLQVIREDGLALRVLLGAHLGAETSNPRCPWGGLYSDAQLAAQRSANDAEVERLIALARRHEDIVFAVAVGNEATVDWSDHLVPVPRLIECVRRVRSALRQPVTVCENYVPWRRHLRPLADELDFISLHTYPVWEYKTIDEALAYSQENYASVAGLYPDKRVVITEAGWPTASNGRGMNAADATPQLQARHYRELVAWTDAAAIPCFVFEAFDEEWKGSADALEPEKHWGLFTAGRAPKLVLQEAEPGQGEEAGRSPPGTA